MNSKWLKDNNYKTQHHKIHRREYRQSILWCKVYQCFLRSFSPGYRNENNNKWDLIKVTGSCIAKETIKTNGKTTYRMGENICKWCDKVLISKIHNSSYNSTTKIAIKKWAEDLIRHFSKDDIQMASRHMKRCSTSLIIREMQIKTTIRYHLTLIRMAIIKMSTNNKMLERIWRKGNSPILLVGI